MEIFKIGEIPAYYATVHMAGDYNHAKQICRLFVLEGACVQITQCDYVYTGGVEAGFTARIMAYARFPKDNEELKDQACRLGHRLCRELGQISFSVETKDTSIYFETELKK